ncbi:MAG: hypothetical protein ACT6Q9_09125 [Polaromonas sp.]|uniref:hypothetical protein n=1 Tax=Polaromonas sp. TaxID=1869339 RepID=UPI004035E038
MDFKNALAHAGLKEKERTDSWFDLDFTEMMLQSYQAAPEPYYESQTSHGGSGTGKVIHLHGALEWVREPNSPTIRIADHEGQELLKHLPAIVPPVMDKSQHYAIERLRGQWISAQNAIQGAEEIIVIGFSFPPTDVSCQFLFKSAVQKGVRVIVINRDPQVRNRYDSVFGGVPGVRLDYSFLGGDDPMGRYIAEEIWAF